MFPNLRVRFRFLAVCFLLAFAVTSCSSAETIPYSIVCNQKNLQSLQGKKLALLSFRFDRYAIASGEAVGESEALPITEYQKRQVIENLGDLFEIIDLSADNTIWQDRLPDPSDSALMMELIHNSGADGAILVTNSYGYEMAGSVVDKVVDGVLSQILPERWVESFSAIRGPSNVEFYYFASNMSIVDLNGEIVWSFYGKVSMMPMPFTGTLDEELQEFGEGVVGLDPSGQTILRAMKRIVDAYTSYNRWLIQAGLEGSNAVNYFTDYPEDHQVRSVGIYPAGDTQHVPMMRTVMEVESEAAPGGPETGGVWDQAKAGKWGRFGEWTAAWAGVKILLISGCVFFLFSRWLDKIRLAGKSNLDEPVGLLAAVFGLAFLVSLFYVLKAVF